MTTTSTSNQLAGHLLTMDDLSTYTQTAVSTLYQLISKGTGPRSVKIGRNRRFRLDDVDSWIDSLADTSSRTGDVK